MNALLLGIGLGYLLEPSGGEETVRSMIEISVPVLFGALFPDIDTVMGRHRKTLHNLPVLLALVAFPYYFDNLYYVWIGILTHYVLDVAGNTRGIALFYPILDREYGLPVGVPANSRSADLVTILVTAGELLLAALLIQLIGPDWINSAVQFAAGH